MDVPRVAVEVTFWHRGFPGLRWGAAENGRFVGTVFSVVPQSAVANRPGRLPRRPY
jgi:hypothetical protein